MGGFISSVGNWNASMENEDIADRYSQEANITAQRAVKLAEKYGSQQISLAEASAQSAEVQAMFSRIDSITAAQETRNEAGRIAREGDKDIAYQKLSFIKSGVDTSGTPIMVLEESRKNIGKEVTALNNRAKRIEQMGEFSANQISAEGRARLLGAKIDAKSRIDMAEINARGIRKQGEMQKDIAAMKREAEYYNMMGEWANLGMMSSLGG